MEDLRASPASEIPSVEDLVQLLGTGGKAVPRLRTLLVNCDPGADHEAKLTALEKLGRFIVAGPSTPTRRSRGDRAGSGSWSRRSSGSPPRSARFQATVRSVLAQTRGIKLFGEVGMPNDRGLLAETTDRLARRLLPEAPAPTSCGCSPGGSSARSTT